MIQNRQPRVLIAEDNALIALDLEELVRSCACRAAGPVATAQEALAILEQQTVDVALVDYLLADGPADPLTSVLNARGIPFALCTGAGEANSDDKYSHTAIVSKPFTQLDILHTINTLVASRLASA